MDPRNHQHILKKILLAINLIASFVLIGVAIVVIYHCFKIQTVLFSWHPSLMALGVSVSNIQIDFKVQILWKILLMGNSS